MRTEICCASRFTMEIPAHTGMGSQPRRRTILLIDDQEAVLACLRFVFELADYRVLAVTSGVDALAMEVPGGIDVALIDVHMPEMGGFEIYSRLRATSLRSSQTWFMTGTRIAEVELRARETGARGVFKKPFDHSDLLRQIESAM